MAAPMRVGDTVEVAMPTGLMPTTNTQQDLHTVLSAGDYLFSIDAQVTYTDPPGDPEAVHVQADFQVESLNDPTVDGMQTSLGGRAYTTAPGEVHVDTLSDQTTLTFTQDLALALTWVGRVDGRAGNQLLAPVTCTSCSLIIQRVRL
jgi:hypothetical protein